MTLFTLKTPGDMLTKALRERERMKDHIHIDHVYNFFVTVAHIVDYVKNSDLVSQQELDTFRQHRIFKLSRDLCDSGKHMKLTQPGRCTPSASIYANSIFQAPFGAWNFGPQKQNWMVHTDGTWTSVQNVADDVLKLWSDFFSHHGIDTGPSTSIE